MTKRARRLGLLGVCLLAVVLVLLLARPLRLFAPSLLGLHCDDDICVEQAEELERLRAMVAAEQGLQIDGRGLDGVPRVVFCATPSCYRRFGGGDNVAMSYPYLGTVVHPDYQHPHIIRHELVHWLQFQHSGALATMRAPEWWREGMAYAHSGARSHEMPEHYLPMVARYRGWAEQRRIKGVGVLAPATLTQ